MVVASLVVAVITLVFALFIHSETRDILSRIKWVTSTLPGAYDVERAYKDIEKSKEFRVTVICDKPKSTHLAYKEPAPRVPGGKLIINRIWIFISKFANCFSGNIEVPVKMAHRTVWEITSGEIQSLEVEKLLKNGWEPFSVTIDEKIWLRTERFEEEKANS